MLKVRSHPNGPKSALTRKLKVSAPRAVTQLKE